MGSMALVAAGIPAVLIRRHDVVAGVLAVAVFALTAVSAAAVMIRPPELLRFGPDGIREGRGPFRSPAQLIPWTDIRAVRIFPYRAWSTSTSTTPAPGVRLSFIPG